MADLQLRDEFGQDTEFDAIAIIDAIYRRLWLLILCAVVGAGLGYLRVRSVPDYYKAYSKLTVDQMVANTLDMEGSSSAPRAVQGDFQRRVQVLNSIPMAQEAYQVLNWEQGPEAEYQDLLQQAERVVDDSPSTTMDDLIEKRFEGIIDDPAMLFELTTLKAKIGVVASVDDSSITISAQGTDPAECARIANAYAKAYEKFSLKQRNYQTRKSLRLLNLSMTRAREQLRKAEDEERQFLEKNNIEMLEKRLEYYSTRVAFEAEQRIAKIDEQIEEIEFKSELEGQATLNTSLEEKRSEIRLEEANIQDLLKRFTSEHPRVQEAQRRVEDLKSAFVRLRGSTTGSASSRATPLKLLKARREKLSRENDAADKQFRLLVSLQSKANAMKRGVEAADRVYTMLLHKQKDTSITLALAVPDVRQVDQAAPPQTPYYPDRVRESQKGSLVGLFLAFMLIFALEKSDSTLKGRDAIQRATGLPVHGIVLSDPAMSSSSRSTDLIVHTDPKCPTAEALKVVRTYLKYENVSQDERCHLITSSSPGEGKTTISCNLAISLAQIGERVLLVDTDLRKPAVHKVFDIKNDIGISQILEVEDVSTLIRATQVPNLFLLSSGPHLSNPAEFLYSPRFRDVAEQLKEMFDRVIFDSPPVNAVSDAGVIANLVHSILFVVRDGFNGETSIKSALEVLSRTGARMSGVVINNLKRPSLPYRYYGGQYQQYYYYNYGRYGDKKVV